MWMTCCCRRLTKVA